jgi:hypothetical protein
MVAFEILTRKRFWNCVFDDVAQKREISREQVKARLKTGEPFNEEIFSLIKDESRKAFCSSSCCL